MKSEIWSNFSTSVQIFITVSSTASVRHTYVFSDKSSSKPVQRSRKDRIRLFGREGEGGGGATRPAAINRRGRVEAIEIGSLNIMSRLNEPRLGS